MAHDRKTLAYESLVDSLSDVGRRHGVTREYVRQCRNDLIPPNLIALANAQQKAYKRAKKSQKERRAEEERKARQYAKVCRVCGVAFRTAYEPAQSCTGHGPYWRTLRGHIAPFRELHRNYVAQIILRDPEKYGEYSTRHAQRVINGDEIDTHGRWLVHGSQAWKCAFEACQNDWPIFKELPEQIQQQVSTAVETVRNMV